MSEKFKQKQTALAHTAAVAEVLFRMNELSISCDIALSSFGPEEDPSTAAVCAMQSVLPTYTTSYGHNWRLSD